MKQLTITAAFIYYFTLIVHGSHWAYYFLPVAVLILTLAAIGAGFLYHLLKDYQDANKLRN